MQEWVGRVWREVGRWGDHCRLHVSRGLWRQGLKRGVGDSDVEGDGDGGSYHFDSAIPGARAEGILRYQVPVYSEDFSIMLFPALDRELVKPNVEELDGAIAGCY